MAFPQTLANLCKVGIRLRSGVRSKLDGYDYFIVKMVFFKLHSSYQNCLAILRFFDSLWDLEDKSWDHELTTQTMSLVVKLW